MESGLEAPLSDGVVRLRPFRVEDPAARMALEWYRDREVLDGVGGVDEEPYDEARVGRMYQYLRSHGELYFIEVNQHGDWVPIGDVTLAPDTIPIVIGAKEWRARGIGARVLALLIQRARVLGYAEMWAKEIWAHNIASQRLFERMGFQRVDVGTDEKGRTWYRYRLNLTV